MIFKICTPRNRLSEVEENVAIAIAKVAYFISPKIVQRIAELNCQWHDDFERDFGEKVPASYYFYQGSACVFPGVRRRASKDERELKLKQYHNSVAAIFDDNVFPRHLWCFLCTGRPYSGPLWKSSGLGKFELAHVLPHKTYEHSGVKDWFMNMPESEPFHGLFSCAANVILLPKGMAKPTDGTAGIRAAVFNRYFYLYGSIHSGGFSGFSLPDRVKWFDRLEWNDPVEPEDWELRIEKLDAYRRKKLSGLLKTIAEPGKR
ncbi:MAG: hypothetical protein JWR19_1131 [Pedosphaera sp.]|nr:hypothetical protein [Pedosphaera sp.]